MGLGLTHTENLMIKKLREMRETNGLDLDLEEAEPTIGRNVKTKFEIPNEYSKNILITDSDFILSDRTSVICITAIMSFNTRLEADFKREYQIVEFLFRQRPGLGGMAALPPSLSQVPGKYLCFLVTRTNERNVTDPQHVIMALTRLRDFLVKRRIEEVSMPVKRLRDLDYAQLDERLAVMLNAILQLESQGECRESATVNGGLHLG